jgi:hypothetical protein
MTLRRSWARDRRLRERGWTELSSSQNELAADWDTVTGRSQPSPTARMTSATLTAGAELPRVAVYGITIAQNAHVLYAATHGRGAYALTLP